MRIAIVTDAWMPQVNGVVRTLQSVRHELEKMGHEAHVFSPDQFYSVPCPTYSEIKLALVTAEKLGTALMRAAPEAIHIATEGPIGQATGAISSSHRRTRRLGNTASLISEYDGHGTVTN